ncbi:MAG: hypothetical protein KIS78_19025, partial [Labilithrix sp.]|nr:hypothetical protein [Labilithrix sp.]
RGIHEGSPAPRRAPVPDEMIGEVVPPARPAAEPTPASKASAPEPPAPTPKPAPVEPPPAPAAPETFSTRAERHARQVANDLAWDSLGTTRKISDRVNAKVQGGTSAVGDYILRRISKSTDPTTSWSSILGKSRADEILPLIEAELAADGRRIGEIVEAHNVRVAFPDVVDPAVEIAREMAKDPTRIQGVKAFQERVEQMAQAFHNARQLRRADQTMSLSDLYYARAKMEGVAHELNRGSAAHDAFKTYLRRIDDMLVTKLDEAATAAGGEGGSRIRELKREYQLGSWAKRAAEDGVNRIKGNNIVGLREGVGAAVGLATGHPLTGLGAALAGKALRERGAAVGAHILSQAAERGVVAKAVRAFDEKVKSAAANVLREGKRVRPEQARKPGRPRKTTPIEGREQQRQTVREGQDIVERIAKIKADPSTFRKGIEDTASVIAENAGPKTADAWTTTAIRAFTFLAAGVPDKPRLDPLDASSRPPLTYDEADRLVTRHRYVTDPMSVWEDLDNGIVTADSVAAAQELMPDAWADFQQHLYAHLTEQMTRNVQLSQSQRLRVYRLLGIPAGSDMRPEMVARYQANFSQQPPAPQGAPPVKPPGGKPVDLKLKQSGFDRAEARASG